MPTTRLVLGRPRPMSAIEAMTGGPWLFGAVALLGVTAGAYLVALTHQLAILYPPGVVTTIATTALATSGLGAALAHALGQRLNPSRLPGDGALVTALAGLLLGALWLLPSTGHSAGLAASATIGLSSATGFTLAAAAPAVDRQSGRLMATWLGGLLLGGLVAVLLQPLLHPASLLLPLALVPAVAALCAARAVRAALQPAISLLSISLLLVTGGLLLRWSLGQPLLASPYPPMAPNVAALDQLPLGLSARGQHLIVTPEHVQRGTPMASGYDLIWLTSATRPPLPVHGLAEAGQLTLTVEAIEHYLSRLTADGLLLIGLPDDRPLARVAATVLASLRPTEAGTTSHLVALAAPAGPEPVLLLARRRAWSEAEAQALQGASQAAGWRPLFVPYIQETAPLTLLTAGATSGRLRRDPSAPNLTPATDQRPFVGISERPWPTNVWLALLSSSLLLLCVLGYLAWTTEPNHYAVWRAVPYAIIGGASGPLLLVPLALRLTIDLGGPATASLAVLITLVLWAALGAALADQIGTSHLAAGGQVAGLLLAAWCGLAALDLASLIDLLFDQPLAVRLLATGLLLAPVGLSLGLLPALLPRAVQRHYAGRPVALVWGIVAGGGALGAALAQALALTLGTTGLFVIAALLGVILSLVARPVLAR